MSTYRKASTDPKTAAFKIHARLDAGESLDSIIAEPPKTKHNKITTKGNIMSEYNAWKGNRNQSPLDIK